MSERIKCPECYQTVETNEIVEHLKVSHRWENKHFQQCAIMAALTIVETGEHILERIKRLEE